MKKNAKIVGQNNSEQILDLDRISEAVNTPPKNMGNKSTSDSKKNLPQKKSPRQVKKQ
jgi:hypothetical protein